MRTLFLAFAVLTCLVQSVQAETIYGRVFDTLKGKILPNTRLVLGSNPNQETTSDSTGTYWFRNVKPGPYLVHIFTAEREVVGRLVVYKSVPTTVANLDLSKIDAPDSDDNY
ncbi:MAG: carboxypeptidase regulatory-like domain-containing protein [Anaerolineae bacterium]|nr:carboxypeptidase regulatory-like domain-containing protein [Gloeobacterales cyanobacterium ES-bin-313]